MPVTNPYYAQRYFTPRYFYWAAVNVHHFAQGDAVYVSEGPSTPGLIGPLFSYPWSVLDEEASLLLPLPSFWTRFYAGKETVRALAAAKAHAAKQAMDNLNEVVDAVGRKTVPVYHRERWLPVTITQSKKLPGRVLAYGESGPVYGNQPNTGVVYTYGGSVDRTVAYAVPGDLERAPYLCDSPLDASVFLTNQIDYQLDAANAKLVFLTDPFADPRFVPDPVYDASGNVVDQTLTLWLGQADRDKEFIWTQFGYVLGVQMPSSIGYKVIVNQLWDALVGGSSRRHLENILAVFAGSPPAVGGDTVEVIDTDAVGVLVVTDQYVYRYGFGANVLVSVGQVLKSGQPIVDAVQLYDLSTGNVPPVRALSLGKGFLHPSIPDDLVFVNEDVPLSATVAADGHTVATFPLGGQPDSVTKFFDLLDARGLANGKTLARVLDVRANPVGEPQPINLPATINPMQFLVANVLRYNTLVAVLDTSSAGVDAAGLSQSRLLRKLLPPTAALLMLIEVTGPGDAISMAGPTYYAESLAPCDAVGPGADTTSAGSFTDGVSSIMYV